MDTNKQAIIRQIKSFFEQEFPNPGNELTETTGLLDEWFIDSLSIVEVVIFLETQFNIKVTRADINGDNFQDITKLSEFVLRRSKQ